MSTWTIITLRGRRAGDYEYSDSASHDRWDATADLAATADEDDRVLIWTTWSGHAYVYLKTNDREDAEAVLRDYAPMVDDAAVLTANDTVDRGEAWYYPDPEQAYTDSYQEDDGDGRYVGQIALSVITARHGIVARDPFHNRCGRLDDHYLEDGEGRR